jgi:spermidine/putrescine transport system substrate-binding protein
MWQLNIMNEIGRRQFIKRMILLGGGLLLPGLPGCAPGGRARSLNFYTYSNYMDPGVVPDFEKEYRLTVNTDYYAKQEILFAKIKIGVTGYDLIVATDNMMRRFLKHRLLLPLEPGRIHGLANLMPRFKSPPYDPGLDYCVPYLWGTTVIAYNRKYVNEPVNSWKILWDPKYKGKISMLDEKRDLIGCALKMLGYSGNDPDRARVEEAKKLLLQQRPLLKKYTSDTYQDELATNETWLCQAWSGDVIQAMRSNPDLDFAVPGEGSFIWVDNLCIPSGAGNPDAARDFISFLLRPGVGYRNAVQTGYPTPLEPTFHLLKEKDPGIADDRRIYPDEKTMEKLEFYSDLGEEERFWNQVMEDVKLGKS